jgi:hypothetical protein
MIGIVRIGSHTMVAASQAAAPTVYSRGFFREIGTHRTLQLDR